MGQPAWASSNRRAVSPSRRAKSPVWCTECRALPWNAASSPAWFRWKRWPTLCKCNACRSRHELVPRPVNLREGKSNKLQLPLWWRSSKENVMEQFAPVQRKDGQPVRYLVVDDSVFARKNLVRMIESFGGTVAGEAGDGVTAISEYDKVQPDIVLMDITMPQMEGIEAAEQIVRQHPEARIVMVSSVGYQENIVAALQRGARHFVQKPVKPEVLYEVIKYVMGEDGAVAQSAGTGA